MLLQNAAGSFYITYYITYLRFVKIKNVFFRKSCYDKKDLQGKAADLKCQ